VLPPAATPWTPLSMSQSIWGLMAEKSMAPFALKGVVKGATMPWSWSVIGISSGRLGLAALRSVHDNISGTAPM
jgi:hypothetical protein